MNINYNFQKSCLLQATT